MGPSSALRPSASSPLLGGALFRAQHLPLHSHRLQRQVLCPGSPQNGQAQPRAAGPTGTAREADHRALLMVAAKGRRHCKRFLPLANLRPQPLVGGWPSPPPAQGTPDARAMRPHRLRLWVEASGAPRTPRVHIDHLPARCAPAGSLLEQQQAVGPLPARVLGGEMEPCRPRLRHRAGRRIRHARAHQHHYWPSSPRRMIRRTRQDSRPTATGDGCRSLRMRTASPSGRLHRSSFPAPRSVAAQSAAQVQGVLWPASGQEIGLRGTGRCCCARRANGQRRRGRAAQHLGHVPARESWLLGCSAACSSNREVWLSSSGSQPHRGARSSRTTRHWNFTVHPPQLTAR